MAHRASQFSKSAIELSSMRDKSSIRPLKGFNDGADNSAELHQFESGGDNIVEKAEKRLYEGDKSQEKVGGDNASGESSVECCRMDFRRSQEGIAVDVNGNAAGQVNIDKVRHINVDNHTKKSSVRSETVRKAATKEEKVEDIIYIVEDNYKNGFPADSAEVEVKGQYSQENSVESMPTDLTATVYENFVYLNMILKRPVVDKPSVVGSQSDTTKGITNNASEGINARPTANEIKTRGLGTNIRVMSLEQHEEETGHGDLMLNTADCELKTELMKELEKESETDGKANGRNSSAGEMWISHNANIAINLYHNPDADDNESPDVVVNFEGDSETLADNVVNNCKLAGHTNCSAMSKPHDFPADISSLHFPPESTRPKGGPLGRFMNWLASCGRRSKTISESGEIAASESETNSWNSVVSKT